MERAAKHLLSMGRSQAVLIKGGHSFVEDDEAGGGVAQDYFIDSGAAADGGVWITSPRSVERKMGRWRPACHSHLSNERSFCPTHTHRVSNPNTHGTGCTLASAITAFLAQALPLEDAVVLGKAYVTQGIRSAVRLGKGPGPVRQTKWPSEAEDFPW